MELSERGLAILETVVSSYIESGEPVGSEALREALGTSLSSATLRNELKDLCEKGYLSQPHTSAGRVPTSEAYRLYISLGSEEPSRDTRDKIDGMLLSASRDPAHLFDLAAEMLARFTGFPAVLAVTPAKGDRAAKVRALPAGRRTALLLLVSEAGAAKSAFCRVPGEITPALLDAFSLAVERYVADVPLSALGEPPRLADPSLDALLAAVYAMAEDLSRENVSFGGDAYSLLPCRGELLRFLSDMDEDVGVIFGDSTGVEALGQYSVVAARYNPGGHSAGRVGVVGPVRMEYRSMLPSVRYFADRLGEVARETISDMEA